MRDAAVEARAGGLRLYVDASNTRAQAVYTALGMNGDHYRVFEEMFSTGKEAGAVIAERGLAQIGGGGELEAAVARAVAENPDKAAAYRAGKTKLFEFFVGQVMRATGGRANPDQTRRLLNERLSGG